MTERRLPGLLSRELHGGERLMVTWVEVAPGAAQRPHAHERSEQVYVIVRGSGVAVVAGEERTVGEGDVVAIRRRPSTGSAARARTRSSTCPRPRRRRT